MFVYAHVDENTGEIVHCFVDNGDDIDFEERIANGRPPVVMLDAPSNIKPRIIKQEEIAEKFADESIGRFPNNKEQILLELKEVKNSKYDARRILEELKFEKTANGLELKVRKNRAKLDEWGNINEED